MANQEHLDTLAKGAELWNAWRIQDPGRRPDLSAAHLAYEDLHGYDFRAVIFTGANLRRANLKNCQFTFADLSGADASGAVLEKADLGATHCIGTNFGGANLVLSSIIDTFLTSADLRGADLRSVHLSRPYVIRGANFGRARMGNTTIIDVDLQGVEGLAEVEHLTPSYIDIRTFYRSEGRIPEPFLRGAGVPENFIAYMRSLTGTAFDFYSCFISYSTRDRMFAQRLYADLQARGVRCWFAPHDMRGGRRIHEQVDEAIRIYDKLLLILSNASMNSNWVKTEIANARAREKQQKRQMLFPIALVPFNRIKSWKLFDPDAGIDIALQIREYYIPDFSNWKDHDCYQQAFERLLRDLKL